MLTTEIPAAAGAGHEGHLDSIFGFASVTLAGAAGFGHCYVSTIRLDEFLERHCHDVALTAEREPHPPHG